MTSHSHPFAASVTCSLCRQGENWQTNLTSTRALPTRRQHLFVESGRWQEKISEACPHNSMSGFLILPCGCGYVPLYIPACGLCALTHFVLSVAGLDIPLLRLLLQMRSFVNICDGDFMHGDFISELQVTTSHHLQLSRSQPNHQSWGSLDCACFVKMPFWTVWKFRGWRRYQNWTQEFAHFFGLFTGFLRTTKFCHGCAAVTLQNNSENTAFLQLPQVLLGRVKPVTQSHFRSF